MASAVHIRAHAKLNLALSVGPPIPEGQPDAGMHPIASWMAPIGLADDIAYEPDADGAGVELDRSWAPDAPKPTSLGWLASADLCVRAVSRLGVHVGRELGGRVRVEKRVPVGGGLGGGSSDAAATLIAANLAHGLGLSLDELADIGSRLGSDVPFFIDEGVAQGQPPRPALVTGLGVRIERVRTPATPVVLCVPGFGCSTPEVYAAFDDAPVTLDEALVTGLASAGAVRDEDLFNDLFDAARRAEPELAEVWRTIRRVSGRTVHLSGSGSAMFLVADDTAHAVRLAESLTLHVPGVAFVATTTEDPTT